jgi:X-Pro dipeptidyl-peptidase
VIAVKHTKKMICILLSLILLCAGAVSVTAADDESAGLSAGAGAPKILGDANLDGEVNIIDATYIQRVLAKYQTDISYRSENLCDTNRSGDIDIMDATLIQRYRARYEVPTAIGEPMPLRTMSFSNGYAKPFVVMNEAKNDDYRNTKSDIIRFVVYVETDYDTDLDGKPDLVKAWVQVPRAAVEGDYGAPVIFEANPYSTSANKVDFPNVDDEVVESLLSHTPAKRVPSGTASTRQIAEDFRYSDITDYSYGDYTNYYYFLSRGFALVGSSGLGTRGSEGLELCGTAMEADAFKAIVEWIHGDRKAYSNRRDNLEVTADWSNGKSGMLGVSYMGTLAYEVAATGVEGLEAIAPTAGISSWYDYTNQQGAPHYGFYEYSAFLSGICASRFYDGIDDENAYNTYLGWRTYITNAQRGLRGNYGDVWDVRDFSQSDKIHASALIIQGLSDDNVRPKQFKLMMEAFERNGAKATAILHQSGHASLGGLDYSMKIGTYENYLWLLNRWFSYYLAGCEGNVDRLPKYIVQSNVDGKFYTYDEWDSGMSTRLNLNDGNGELKLMRNNTQWYNMYLTDDVTVKGTVEVHLRVKAENLDFDKSALVVNLVDLSTESFTNYCGDGLYQSTVARTPLYDDDDNRMVSIFQFLPKTVTQTYITHGQIDLCTPDAGWSPQSAVAPETPVKANEWHDYVVYLEPDIYTVMKGHYLFVGVEPKFDNFSGDNENYNTITIDQSASYAIIPTDTASTMPYSR